MYIRGYGEHCPYKNEVQSKKEKLIAKTHVETFWSLFHDLHDNYVSIIST